MARNGGGVYSLPAIYEATTGETATAEQHNTPLEDLEQDANTARPIVAGGTGGTTEQAALTNLFDNSAYVRDSKFILADADDTARKLRLDLANITTGNTRVITAPDRNMDLAKVPDASLAQSFTTDEKAQLLENIGAAWELISSAAYSSAAAVDFTDLEDYRHLRVHVFGTVATDGASLALRTSTNNGSSFDAGATDYSYSYNYGGALVSQTANQAALIAGVNIDNATPFSVVGEFLNFNQATVCHYHGTIAQRTAGNVHSVATASGARESTTARDALRITTSGGNLTIYVVLEGLR